MINVSFQVELEIWKASLYSHELDSFPMPEYFCDEIGGDINKTSIKNILWLMCQHLEGLCNLWNQ